MLEISEPIEFLIAALLAALLLSSAALWWNISSVSRRVKAIFGGAGETEEDFKRNLARRTAWLEAKAEELEKRLSPIETISRMSIQKVGFLRFNPFRDTGGDNSFAIALLDLEHNGIILSSFYTREGVRVYSKKIENGVSKHPLSDEEKQVLGEALGTRMPSKG